MPNGSNQPISPFGRPVAKPSLDVITHTVNTLQYKLLHFDLLEE